MDNLLPAIVIPAWQRPESLRRLLNCLQNAHYPEGEIRLILSVEGECAKEVLDVVEQTEWTHGPFDRTIHQQRLGLREHLLMCGDYAKMYGAVIVLEDDIYVTPDFYNYTLRALAEYGGHPRIAGVALYSYAHSENGFFPFVPLEDGNDLYFMQVACSWGQAWTASQWDAFREFLQQNPEMESTPGYPEYLKNWSTYSWKKHFIRYLHATDKYFVYPRVAYSTPFAEGGISKVEGNLWQVPLRLAGLPATWPQPEVSRARYDAWFELEPTLLQDQFPQIPVEDLVNDLHGTKRVPEDAGKYVISTRQCLQPIRQWGLQMTPPEQNIICEIPGNAISLAPATAFNPTTLYPNEFSQKWNAGMQTAQTGTGKISIGILSDGGNEAEKSIETTLTSVWANEFAGIEVVLLTPPGVKIPQIPDRRVFRHIEFENDQAGAGVGRLLESLGYPIVCIVQAGTQFHPDAFQAATAIFQEFPEIQWLGEMGEGDPGKARLLDRWNPYLLSYKFRRGNLNLPVNFWHVSRRFQLRLDQLAQSSEPELTLWIQLQQQMPHYTAAKRFSVSRSRGKKKFTLPREALVSGNFPAHLRNSGKAALFFPFYKWNVPYLRFAFLEDGKMSDVIRFDEHHGNWYKSRY